MDQENASCFDPIGGNKVTAPSDNCPVYAVLPNKEALVYAQLSDDNLKSKLLEFRISGSNDSEIKKLTAVFFDGNRFRISLPPRKDHYTVFVFYKGKEISKLEVRVYPERTEEVIVVPIASNEIDEAQLESYLGSVFKATNVRFNVTIDSLFDASFTKPFPSSIHQPWNTNSTHIKCKKYGISTLSNFRIMPKMSVTYSLFQSSTPQK